MKHLTLLLVLLAASALAQTPSPSAPVPKQLASLMESYEAALRQKVTSVFDAAVVELDAKYSAALDRALATAKQAGKLEDAIIIRDEKKRLAEKLPVPPLADGDPEALKPLRATYRAALANLALVRDQNAAPLKATLDKALSSLQAELTKAGDLDGALVVKAAREDVKAGASVSQAPASTIESGPPGRKESDSPAKLNKYDPEAARAIIEWIFSGNGDVSVRTEDDASLLVVKKLADLPKGRFELVGARHSHSTKKIPATPFPWSQLDSVTTLSDLSLTQQDPITPDQIRHLGSLSELKSLALPHNVMPDETFRAMPRISTLTRLSVYTTERVAPSSEEHLDKLADCFPNVSDLDIGSRFPFTDSCALKLQRWPGLTRLVGTGKLTDGVLRGFGALNKLDTIFIVFGPVDEPLSPDIFSASLKNLRSLAFADVPNAKKLLPEIARLPRLEHLGVENGGITLDDVAVISKMKITSLALADNKSLSDKELAIIASMRGLKRLDFRGTTAMTDAGLDHLHSLEHLEVINLGRSKITPEGIAALKRALPKCRVLN